MLQWPIHEQCIIIDLPMLFAAMTFPCLGLQVAVLHMTKCLPMRSPTLATFALLAWALQDCLSICRPRAIPAHAVSYSTANLCICCVTGVPPQYACLHGNLAACESAMSTLMCERAPCLLRGCTWLAVHRTLEHRHI